MAQQQLIIRDGEQSVQVTVSVQNPWGDFPSDPDKIRRLAKILAAFAGPEETDRKFERDFIAARIKSRRDSLGAR